MMRLDGNSPEKNGNRESVPGDISFFYLRELLRLESFFLLVIDIRVAGLELRLKHAAFFLQTRNTKPSNFIHSIGGIDGSSPVDSRNFLSQS